MKVLIRALVAGLLVAFSLPPWGWWPLTFAGIALYAPLIVRHNSARLHHFLAGFVFGVGWFIPALVWMWFLTIPGYIIAVLLFSAMHGIAATVAGHLGLVGSTRRAAATALGHTLAEALRFSFPFGGIPLASIGIAQASSPFSYLAPVGGVLLITYATFRVSTASRILRFAIGLVLISIVSTLVSGIESTGVRRIALVQGGGKQGTHAVDTNPRDVFQRHLETTRTILTQNDIDVVIWPENVVDVNDFATSPELALIGEEAVRLLRPIVVGVTEKVGTNRFTNAQVIVSPGKQLAGRYDKKRRVPFGEYIPLRSLLSAIGAPTDLVPRDAVPGTSDAVLNIDGIPAGVAISWEIFFGGRVNEGVSNGAQFIMNPTNGSSYTWTVLQTQQIAASRLRAREQSRWVVQVAPTGFSAFISPTGKVIDRTQVSEQKVIIHNIELREGRTVYSRLGNSWIVLFFIAAFALVVWRDRRQRFRERRAVWKMTADVGK